MEPSKFEVAAPAAPAIKSIKLGALVEWHNLRYTVHEGNKKRERVVLSGVSGRVAPKQMLAIMGPSGSGKTSLLNVLAARVPWAKHALLTGSVLLNGHDLTAKMAKLSAYVEQHEALFALSTVRETLMFTAQLRLPSSMALSQMAERVDATITELNLVSCADTLVGGVAGAGPKIRGLSGGERRRVTIGVELLNDPPIVFMDEPTSGLDSFQAQAVMETLRTLADAGRTVVASIHQPRSSIYQMLDQVCLLASGRTVFFGAAGDVLSTHFAGAGHPIPASYNPSDFVIDLISVDFRDPVAAKTSAVRLEALLDAWAAHEEARRDVVPPTSSTAAVAAGPSAVVGEAAAVPLTATKEELLSLMLDHQLTRLESCGRAVVAFKLLTQRCLQELTRDRIALVMKYVASTFFSLLFGLVYYQMDKSQTSLQNRTGILFFTAMNLAFGTTIDTSSVIPAQLAVVSRERAARMYSILPYYLANWLCRVPLDVLPQIAFAAVQYYLAGLRGGADHFFIFFGIIALELQCAVALGMLISALLPSVEAAPQLAPLVIVLFLTFSGYFLNEDSIPDWIGWFKYISFIRYAFQALMINEFAGNDFLCEFEDGTPADACLDGDAYLQRLNFDDDSIALSCVLLMVLAVAFNAAAYSVLVARRPHFQKLEPPATTALKSKLANSAVGVSSTESYQ